MSIPHELNQLIRRKLEARQSFFTLVSDIRRVQKLIYQDHRCTPNQRNWLVSHLDRLDGILDHSANFMLSEGIIVKSPPSQFNGGTSCPYYDRPCRFDFDLTDWDWSRVPPLMEFTLDVLFMRKWQILTKLCEGHRQHCYHNLFEFQTAVDNTLAKGWLWDQAQVVRYYLRQEGILKTPNNNHNNASNQNQDH